MNKLILLAFGLVITAQAALAGEKLVIGTEAGFEPFAYVDKSGKLVGFEIELGDAICAKAAFDCTWQNTPFDGLFTGLEAGKFDVVIAAISITEERKQKFAFSIPYFEDKANFAAKKGSGLSPTHEGMKKATIGTITGSVLTKFIKEPWADIQSREYPSFDEAWADLKAGRIDAVFGVKSQLSGGYLSKPENSDFELIGDLEDPNFTKEFKFAAVFDKDRTEKLAAFDAALEAVRTDGTLDKLVAKYFPGLK